MTFKEAKELSMKSRWKTSLCNSGEKCWCRIIEPETPIKYDEIIEYYIAPSGCLTKDEAEYFVKLHNDSLEKPKLYTQEEYDKAKEESFDKGYEAAYDKYKFNSNR